MEWRILDSKLDYRVPEGQCKHHITHMMLALALGHVIVEFETWIIKYTPLIFRVFFWNASFSFVFRSYRLWNSDELSLLLQDSSYEFQGLYDSTTYEKLAFQKNILKINGVY